ncbi:sigma-70 family RNA polymerase sigma factor [Salipiger sp.]|uniref:sigma-70 family RNA polymerase sigma factor n=1 Tax=Salipiger sp. TaxID=2078585 RepID=UPI003A97FF13
MSDRNARWGDLLSRALAGDGVAYATFLTETSEVIRRVVRARSPGGAEDIEDIVQEVLLAVHTKRHTWRRGEPVSPWLWAITRYKTTDAFRRRKWRATLPIEDFAEILPEDGAGDITAPRDLERLLGGIDARSARIVRAVGLDGESAGDVGARLGMSEGAVRVAYHRAMTRLKQLAEMDGTE